MGRPNMTKARPNITKALRHSGTKGLGGMREAKTISSYSICAACKWLLVAALVFLLPGTLALSSGSKQCQRGRPNDALPRVAIEVSLVPALQVTPNRLTGHFLTGSAECAERLNK